MIQSTHSSITLVDKQAPSWQQLLSTAVRDTETLLNRLDLPLDLLEAGNKGAKSFPVRVPEPYLNRIEKGNPNDPLLRQVLPLIEESELPPEGFVLDPLEEQAANKVPGIVHKYDKRVLLITNGSCAVHCRYCFRRHFPYDDNRLSSEEWDLALDYIRQRPELDEVILSGGDPLSNNDQRLFKLIESIESIPHIKKLRIHTRLPVVIPQRITPELAQRLRDSTLTVVMVIHANHANELDEAVCHRMGLLRNAGVHLLNQAVLLKGVNDHAEALVNLSEALFDCHVLPYYLHQLDPVVGAHHYNVEDEHAIALIGQMRSKLAGYLVPKLVREEPGAPSKTPILGR